MEVMLSAAVFQAERSISGKQQVPHARSLHRLNCADVRDDAFR
jgi:hypothetical protein